MARTAAVVALIALVALSVVADVSAVSRCCGGSADVLCCSVNALHPPSLAQQQQQGKAGKASSIVFMSIAQQPTEIRRRTR